MWFTTTGTSWPKATTSPPVILILQLMHSVDIPHTIVTSDVRDDIFLNQTIGFHPHCLAIHQTDTTTIDSKVAKWM